MGILSPLGELIAKFRYGELDVNVDREETISSWEREKPKRLTIERFDMMHPGNGASSRYLDGLPHHKEVVLKDIVPSHITKMLEARGFNALHGKHDDLDDWVRPSVKWRPRVINTPRELAERQREETQEEINALWRLVYDDQTSRPTGVVQRDHDRNLLHLSRVTALDRTVIVAAIRDRAGRHGYEVVSDAVLERIITDAYSKHHEFGVVENEVERRGQSVSEDRRLPLSAKMASSQ